MKTFPLAVYLVSLIEISTIIESIDENLMPQNFLALWYKAASLF